ncbi:acetate--CoA ligase family protein [Peribacillus frigoritolerans]|nr:acetate--CoA ligase family protein [Peribacillus frigoritolerans]
MTKKVESRIESPLDQEAIDIKSSVPVDTKELTEYKSKQLIAKYNLPVTKRRLALNAKEAVEYANLIGYPVALKGMSPQILHKTEKGLVLLNIENEQEVEEGFNKLKNYY